VEIVAFWNATSVLIPTLSVVVVMDVVVCVVMNAVEKMLHFAQIKAEWYVGNVGMMM
jgi:hypothetical protein